MRYLSEFGDDFELGFNLSDYPFMKDLSWHNDQSPRFEWSRRVLWVNHLGCEEYPRYTVYHVNTNEEGETEIDNDICYLSTNEPSELMAYLSGYKADLYTVHIEQDADPHNEAYCFTITDIATGDVIQEGVEYTYNEALKTATDFIEKAQ